jgi:RNA polymerase sigma factor (sigma-70 family)
VITTQEGTLVTDEGRPTKSGQPVSTERLSPDAVRALYDIHGRDLLAFLSGVLRNSDAAEDVCQITFQRVLESGHEAREETIRGWLFKVAFHEAMAYRRKQVRRHESQLESLDLPGTENLSSGMRVEELVRVEEIDRLKQLLAGLPADQQFVVQRRIQEDKTFAAIAEELQVPLGTVLTRMRLAIQKLQKWFGRDGRVK